MVKIIITLSIFLQTTLLASSYWSIDEYLNLHPHQKDLMNQFNTIVQSDALPIDKDVKKVKISMLYPGEQITDYWRRSEIAFKARMDELQIPYELNAIFIDENDLNSLRNNLIQLLQLESDYLVFTLNIDGHKRLISQIINNQKPKIILQNITTPLIEWGDNQPFLYVGFDHLEGTKLLASHIKKQFGKDTNYLMLYHNEGYVSQMRGDGFIDLVNDTHRLNGAFYTYVDKELAKNIVLNYKNLDQIDYIYSCSTDIAIGASEALEELGIKDQIFLNGWGGGDSELAMIEDSSLDITVMRINDDNAVAMAEAIKLDLLGFDVPTIYSGEFVIIDKDTDRQKIEKIKQRAFRYSQ